MSAEFQVDKNDGKGLQHQPCLLNIDGTLRKPPVLTMNTGGTQVTAGGSVPGWVSGDIANLAAGTNTSVYFDLGPQWDQYAWGSCIYGCRNGIIGDCDIFWRYRIC